MMVAQDRGLSRRIGRWDLVAILINVVIGAGILGLPAKSFALIGPYSVAAWFLCAAIMGVVAACFAEVGSQFAQTGGPYLYAHAAFGETTGIVVGWLSWISRLFSFATIANLSTTYLGGLGPALTDGAPRAAYLVVLTTGLTALVLCGVRWAAYINNALTVCKLTLLIGFTVVCLPFIDVSRLSMHVGSPSSGDWQAAIMLMTFGFLGVESAMITTGEMKNPGADVPFALGAGLAIIALLYLAVQVVCIGTVPDLASSSMPIVDAATRALGPMGGWVVGAGALVTMCGTLFAVLLTGSRLPFALAEQGQLPRCFGAVHGRMRTPHIAILASGLGALLLTLYSSFLGALIVTALTRLVGYMTTCGALIVLRARMKPAQRRGFRLRGGGAVAVAGIIACGWLMAGSSRRELVSLLLSALVGVVVSGGYVIARRLRA